jgi:hypothetical protein
VEVGVECWTCLGEWGWGKGLICQCQILSKWMQEKQQRLTAGVRWQANLPEDPLAPSRNMESHKCWDQEWDEKPTSQSKAYGGSQSRSLGQGEAFKTELPTLLGEELTKQSCNWRAMQLLPVKTTALTTLHKLTVLPDLTVLTNLVDRRTKHYSQASYVVRPHQSFHLYANTSIGPKE